MLITRTHRKGATSFFVLATALLLPLAQGEVATAQILPEVAPVSEMAVQPEPAVPAPVIAPVVEEVKEEAAQPKILAEGTASYYGAELAGNKTASGERFNPNALTAAHRTLPMGTKLRVTNKANGKSVIVRINDRGPFAKNRIIDVSRAAAQQISMVRSGTARVVLEHIS
jgi:rare lipoprotein A